MTLLAEDATLWDVVFREPPQRLRFVRRVISRAGPDVLDVGCATGSLCACLRGRGARPVGVDINPAFIEAARAKDPEGRYVVADMRRLNLRRRFHVVLCLGTTFAYNLTNDDIAATLRGFRRHLRPGGVLVVDVLNAIAFMGPTPFRRTTRHTFSVEGRRRTAAIVHRLRLKEQLMSEQVTWRGRDGGRAWCRRDPEEWLRLLFPQELAHFLEVAGFQRVILSDSFARPGGAFGGRRLVAKAVR